MTRSLMIALGLLASLLGSTVVHAVDMVSVKSYGATGDGSTDDTAAIQSACDDAQSSAVPCYFPAGMYRITSPIVFSGGGNVVKGDGPLSIVYTTNNISMFRLSTSADSYNNSFMGLQLIGGVSGVRTSNVGIEIGSGGGASWISNNIFEDLTFAGVYYGIKVTKANSGVLGELRFNWNRFVNIQTSNYGLNNTDYAIRFDNGSGTGNIFANMNLVVGQYGLYFNGGVGHNVGDIVITGIHVGNSGGGAATGVYVTPPPAGEYRSHISVTSSQFDAGITTALALNGVNLATVQNISYGGATSSVVTGRNNKVSGADVAIAEHGARKSGIGAQQGAYLFYVEPVEWNGAMVELVTSGLAQCRGAGVTTTRYHLTRNGSTGVTTATQISNSQSGDGGALFTHGVSVASGVASFYVIVNGTCGGSWANSVMRAVGEVRQAGDL